MATSRYSSVFLPVIAFLLLVLVWQNQTSPVRAQGKKEYSVATVYSNQEDSTNKELAAVLAAKANSGWELVTAIPEQWGNLAKTTLVFAK